MQFTSHWNWIIGINYYNSILAKAIDSIKVNLPKYSRKRSKSIEISGLNEFTNWISGRFDPDSVVVIQGTYSEYPLVMGLSSLFPASLGQGPDKDASNFLPSPLIITPNFALPIRLRPIRRLGLSALYDINANGMFDNFIPLFYRPKIFENQINLSGKRVKISGKIVFMSNRWSNLYVPEKIPKIDNTLTPHIGLLINDIKVIGRSKSFLLDLWRFDQFKLNNPEEERLEFYAKFSPLDWPDTAGILRNHLLSTTLKSIITGTVSWFGIVPRVNIVNSHQLKKARYLLRNFYVNTFQSATSQGLIPINSIGRGLCESHMLQNCECIYQYDQIDPILNRINF